MSNRYLTHFTTILMLHLLLLVGGIKMLQHSHLSKALNSSASRLEFVARVLHSRSLPEVQEKKVPRPKKAEATALPERFHDPVPRPQESAISQKVKADLRETFKSELRAEIEKNKFYPPISRRLGQTGTVVVAFTLLEDGHIIDVRLDTPSRFERLNESALNAVKKVHKFKPIPPELGDDQMDIKVPVNFVTI